MPKAGTVEIKIGNEERSLYINDPILLDWNHKKMLKPNNYPYADRLSQKEYDQTLEQLQIELVKLQVWLQTTGKRALVLFEGRNAAGKVVLPDDHLSSALQHHRQERQAVANFLAGLILCQNTWAQVFR